MGPRPIQTSNLKLVFQTRDDVRAFVEQMPAHEKDGNFALLNGLINFFCPIIPGFYFAVVPDAQVEIYFQQR